MRNKDQIKFWNNEGGDFWAEEADDLDIFLEPLLEAILATAKLKPKEHVLDIGCGPGALTIAAAVRTGSALGLDVSAQLIALAKDRAKDFGIAVEFIKGDASVYTPVRPVDVIVSRIGVMFFDHPVETFKKLRQDASANARLVFASWASMINNPWMVEIQEVLKPLLKDEPPEQKTNESGAFSLSDPVHVKELLEAAGWKEVTITLWQDKLGVPAESQEEAAIFFSKN